MVEKISRSEQKRLFKQVEQLAAELAQLGDSDLKRMPGGGELREEIIHCRGLKGGARKRQVKYMAKLLRNLPLEEIYTFLQERKGSALKERNLHHRAERWRDVIINEAMEIMEDCRQHQLSFEPDYRSTLIAEILDELPTIDETDLRRCIHQYVRTRNKTHYRELFRMVKAAMDAEERTLRMS